MVKITKNITQIKASFMLIEFSVENFRSIKEEQTLSMVKNSSSEMNNNYSNTGAPNVPDLLHSSVIYGANASGKSSLIKALLNMASIIENSFNKKINEELPYTPFLLDSDWVEQPTTFNVNFIAKLPNSKENTLKPVRVEYGFSYNQSQILEEWLSVYPNGREQSWFHRVFDEEINNFVWSKESSHFKGSKDLWKKNTRKDQLYLSTAVQLNSEQLKPIFDWFTENLRILDHDRIDSDFTKQTCQNEKIKPLIISLLQQADIDVDDIEIKKDKLTLDKLKDEFTDEFKQSLIKSQPEILEAYFIHTDKDGNKIKINIDDESDGTQKIFEYAAPIFHVLFHGYTFVVDELNKSLHTDLVRFLVKIFNSELNKENAQLIFTTHETSVLRKDLLRRDQVWFCEKNKDKSTSLYPLTDFKPHKDREDIEESYLVGRYGGKPLIKNFVFPHLDN